VTGIALVTLHLNEKNLKCAYGTTKNFSAVLFALSISHASGRIPPPWLMEKVISIRFQFELSTFSVFVCAALRRNRARIAANRIAIKK
jgi:hypothetical protein